MATPNKYIIICKLPLVVYLFSSLAFYFFGSWRTQSFQIVQKFQSQQSLRPPRSCSCHGWAMNSGCVGRSARVAFSRFCLQMGPTPRSNDWLSYNGAPSSSCTPWPPCSPISNDSKWVMYGYVLQEFKNFEVLSRRPLKTKNSKNNLLLEDRIWVVHVSILGISSSRESGWTL